MSNAIAKLGEKTSSAKKKTMKYNKKDKKRRKRKITTYNGI